MADEGVPLVIWGIAEAAVTIMASSVPMLRVLVRSVRPSRRDGNQRSHGASRSRRGLVETTTTTTTTASTGGTRRTYYYNRPRKDLVSMTGSTGTWTSDSK